VILWVSTFISSHSMISHYTSDTWSNTSPDCGGCCGWLSDFEFPRLEGTPGGRRPGGGGRRSARGAITWNPGSGLFTAMGGDPLPPPSPSDSDWDFCLGFGALTGFPSPPDSLPPITAVVADELTDRMDGKREVDEVSMPERGSFAGREETVECPARLSISAAEAIDSSSS